MKPQDLSPRRSLTMGVCCTLSAALGLFISSGLAKGIMKHSISILKIVSSCIAIQAVDACAGTAFSNIGQTPVGSLAIASNSWRAEQFFTGTKTGGYWLDSVTIQLGSPVGTPFGFSLGIYDNNGLGGFTPGNLLQSLSGAEPSVSGTFTFLSSSLLLTPNSSYFIVATADSPLTSGSFQWDTTSWVYQGHAYEFGAGGLLFQSLNGQTWTYSRPNNYVFAINATAVPEPSSLVLLGMGCSILFYASHLQVPVKSLAPAMK